MNPYTIDSKNKKASVIFTDGVDYAIEIKGNLTDKDEIERALKQIESVKNYLESEMVLFGIKIKMNILIRYQLLYLPRIPIQILKI